MTKVELDLEAVVALSKCYPEMCVGLTEDRQEKSATIADNPSKF
jgi:hypothetical protein